MAHRKSFKTSSRIPSRIPPKIPPGHCEICGGPGAGDPKRRGICARCWKYFQIAEKGLIKWKCPKCKAPNQAVNVTVSELAAVLKAKPWPCLTCGRNIQIGDLGGMMN